MNGSFTRKERTSAFSAGILAGITLMMVLSSANLAGSTLLIPPAPAKVTVEIVRTSPSGDRALLGPIAPPRIPHPVTGPSTPVGQVIDPNAGYTAEPAPMGIADFGVTASDTAYTYSTPEFLGTMSWTSIDIGGSGNSWTLQLNVVLKFVNSGTTYSYWIQDVAYPTTDAGNAITMSYIDNIWNFSGSFDMNSNTLKGNGTIQADGSDDYYEVGASSSLPGESKKISAPGSFQLLVRSYTASTGQPEVAFEYYDGASSLPVTYDNVVFTFAKHVSSDPGFTVDGTQDTPAGSPLTWSAELDTGGPGDGSSVAVDSTTHATYTLYKWNGDNWQSTGGAWNFGGDTGETVSSDQSIWTWNNDGTLMDTELNGTTRDATPEIAYSPDQISYLNLTTPCAVSDGSLSVGATKWDFNGTWANITLYPGTYPMWVNDSYGSDALGATALTAGQTAAVTASSAVCSGGGSGPSISSFTVAPSTIPVGGTADFNVTATGGTSPYTYVYNNLPAGCTSSSTISLACSPSTAGVYTGITVTVTDSASKTATSSAVTLTVQASSKPVISAFTVLPATIPLGGTAFVNTTASGGTAPLTYAYSGLPAGCTSTSTPALTCTPTAAGSFPITVTVTDKNGNATTSNSVTLTVSAPAISAFTVLPGTIPLGGTAYFNVTASGGAGGYTYVYNNLPSGCTSSSSAAYTCAPSTAGTYSGITVTVTDKNGNSVTSSAQTLVVKSAVPNPTLSAITASRTTADIGQTVTFSATASGGSGTGYTFTWKASSAALGCAASTTSTYVCVPTAASTTYTVSATVTDSVGGTSSLSTSSPYTVYADPTVSVPVASVSSIDVGQSVSFSAQGSGGTNSFSAYTWTASSSELGCAASAASTVTCTPASGGTYTVTVTVTDSNGFTSAGATSASYTVDPLPSVSTPSPSVTSAEVKMTIGFSTSASGGTEIYNGYVWTESSAKFGCTLTDATTIDCTPTAAGAYTVSVYVTDSNNGESALATSASYTVAANPSVTLSVSPGVVAVNGTTFLNASATGGIGTLTFAYTGLPAGCSSQDSPSIACVPSQNGNFTVGVTVTDSKGYSAQATATLEVDAVAHQSNNGGGSGGSGNALSSDLWLLLLVLAIVVVAIVAVAISRRKKGPMAPPPQYPSWYEGPMAGAPVYGAANAPPAPPPGGASSPQPMGDGQTWSTPPQ